MFIFVCIDKSCKRSVRFYRLKPYLLNTSFKHTSFSHRKLLIFQNSKSFSFLTHRDCYSSPILQIILKSLFLALIFDSLCWKLKRTICICHHINSQTEFFLLEKSPSKLGSHHTTNPVQFHGFSTPLTLTKSNSVEFLHSATKRSGPTLRWPKILTPSLKCFHIF